ncbi:MAG: tetratricopeptide repeat protein, partial [Gemmatimonadota bacterium]
MLSLMGAPVHGQAQPQQNSEMARGYDLERRSDFAGAEVVYRKILESRPADMAALVGLERVLTQLNRPADLSPALRQALAVDSTKGLIYGLAIRTFTTLGQPDSVRRIGEQWSRILPDDDAAYREWGMALVTLGDRQGARKAFLLGRDRLKQPDVMAAELAQLAITSLDYATGTREWLLALQRIPGYRATASATLASAPENARAEILRQIDQASGTAPLMLSVDLRSRWGDPLGALDRLKAALPAPDAAARDVLQQFLESNRNLATVPNLTARARALELLAQHSLTAQQAALRVAAARAFGAAGDQAAARRVLALAASSSGSPIEVAGAATALIELMVAADSVEAAASQLPRVRPSIPAEEYARLTRLVAEGWIRRGAFERADTVLANDSTVDGLALRGRLALYRGDLTGARTTLHDAGPFAGSRESATERTALLAVLQPIEQDSFPELGRAFLALARGDTASAISGLTTSSQLLGSKPGGPELLLLAGRLSLARGRPAEAEPLLKQVVAGSAPAAATAAGLELAQLYIAQHRQPDALAALEHLVLTYPQSPLVPQARRLMDVAK